MINRSFIGGVLVCSAAFGAASLAGPRLSTNNCASGIPVAAAYDNGARAMRVLRCDGTQWFCSVDRGGWYQQTFPVPQLPDAVVVDDIVLWTGQTVLTRDGHGWIWREETNSWADLGFMPHDLPVSTKQSSWSDAKREFK
jgi:hypothetical protein